MQLSKEAIKEFREIYKEEYGLELPDSEVMEKATRLLLGIKVSYKPIPENAINKKT